MRRSDKKIENRDELTGIMLAGKIIRVAFADSEPYVLPFNYAFDRDRIFIHCAREGRKLDIIKKDQRVAFEVSVDTGTIEAEQPCKFGFKYRCVIGKGAARFSTDINEITKGLDLIMKQISGKVRNIYDPDMLSKTGMIIIVIKELSGKKSGY